VTGEVAQPTRGGFLLAFFEKDLHSKFICDKVNLPHKSFIQALNRNGRSGVFIFW
jgi:hypothetical protein